MSRRPLDFYFDFMSPFSYLAFQKLPGLCEKYGLELRSHVVDLPKLKLLAGNTGPANVTIPLKARYLRMDLARWASRYGVSLISPKSLETGAVNRAYFFALDRGKGPDFLRAAWDGVWNTGGDPADPALLERLAIACGCKPEELDAWSGSEEAITRLKAATQAAHDAGVFGVPTMVLGDQMWWGNDRLTFMEDALSKGLLSSDCQ
ncbi:2-hydroxychromene-2-carboxylate isomerase [Celeribacter indicus]|uniref:2-hydroxychromene-2-carboxylate isomerase n=1 Tax=Celeribacter indicus TaxID=1208324 RepID=A0A0B5DXW3_9RHOB|nr:2-hydroxychromene-2-carboxylate isomerase [Celeribacter indicus]AJE45067.1 2-hydroxychromene-2-carboxylate isomerase [Celeribacter indicus]SDX42521.1 2-hydroxychromene-2-carboxylate isomerase [Celeribacter indicus]